MKKLLMVVVITSLYLTAGAQAIDSLKRDIRQYIPVLNHHLIQIRQTERIDSIKYYAADIHHTIDAFFLEIRRVYQSDKKDREGGANLGIATALNQIGPGSGSYFLVAGINSLLNHTDNDKYYKRLNKVNSVAEKIQNNTEEGKLPKLKERLAGQVAKLNKMQLK